MSNVESLREALRSPNARAWLRVIRAGETSQDGSAYSTMFGGSQFTGWKHPRIVNHAAGLSSTAAGAYQFLARTWDECEAALNLPDFSPESQDLAALFLTARRGALQDVLHGRIESAIAKCNKEWASLPGSPYGQPTRTLRQALATYAAYGGMLEPATTHAPTEPAPPAAGPLVAPQTRTDYEGAPPQERKTMPLAPIIAAVLPSLISSIPKLGRIFGSGSEVAERNVRAAQLVVDAVTQATGAVNAQDAAERLASDPAAVQAATKAVDAIWYELTEAGGGGIDGARKADAAAAGRGDILHSPSFWVTLALLPLVYLVVGSVVGLWGTEWPADVRAAIGTAVVSLIVGGAAGYYWGQTTSRNRTPSA